MVKNQNIERVLDQLKMEVAQEIGVQLSEDGYNGDLTSRDAGRVGGQMVKRMIQYAEQQLSKGE